jgi:hypothetical protein
MMKKACALVAVSLTLALGFTLDAGCGGEVAILQHRGNLGAVDAGDSLCGTARCVVDELCCAARDESCSPTCMKATTCPVYDRPCTLDAGASDSGTPRPDLNWYATCGDPVCSDGGSVQTPTCAPLGSSCTTKGATCGDPMANCGVIHVCDDHDPKGSPANCPISSKKYKDEIAYLDGAELRKLHDETLAMRLATYRYKGPFIDPSDPKATHLGFIVEDQGESLSVERGHDRVDLYGYVSMAVATLQVQEREIAALRKEIAEVRARAESCGASPKPLQSNPATAKGLP